MGNKSNTTLQRLSVNKNWKAVWYQPPKDYADTFIEDLKIRNYVQANLAQAGIADLVIKRDSSKVTLVIYSARPGIVIGKGGSGTEAIEKNLGKITGKVIKTRVVEVKNAEIQPKLIAEEIANQLARRGNAKRIIQKYAQAAMATGLIKGIHIWVKGRIKNADLATKAKVELGFVPRHTLRADIDYAFTQIVVPPKAGMHGIKVWVNRGEKSDYDIVLD